LTGFGLGKNRPGPFSSLGLYLQERLSGAKFERKGQQSHKTVPRRYSGATEGHLEGALRVAFYNVTMASLVVLARFRRHDIMGLSG
jgi:hypothetical protein